MPETVTIGERYEYKNVECQPVLVPIDINVEIIPTDKVFVQLFENYNFFK